ncbi:MAG: macro domain-containing protein [Bacteroidota bacterium]
MNCVGVMGKGIALEFKKRFPEMYDDYARRCAAGEVRLGEPYLFRRPVLPWILNFPTKGHWRSVARLSDIVRGLEYLTRHYQVPRHGRQSACRRAAGVGDHRRGPGRLTPEKPLGDSRLAHGLIVLESPPASKETRSGICAS